MTAVLDGQLDFLSIPRLVESVMAQVDGAGWGLQNAKLKGSYSTWLSELSAQLCRPSSQAGMSPFLALPSTLLLRACGMMITLHTFG